MFILCVGLCVCESPACYDLPPYTGTSGADLILYTLLLVYFGCMSVDLTMQISPFFNRKVLKVYCFCDFWSNKLAVLVMSGSRGNLGALLALV